MDGNNMNNQSAEYTYAAEGTYEVVENKGSNALSIVALITGILSIVCCCVPIASWLTGAAGIVCGVLGMKRCPNVVMARIGMILGIVGVAFGTIMFIYNLVSILTGGSNYMDYLYY